MNIFLLIPESIKSFLILIYSTMILFMLVIDSLHFSEPYSNLYLDRRKKVCCILVCIESLRLSFIRHIPHDELIKSDISTMSHRTVIFDLS